jgi:hypothetical protein
LRASPRIPHSIFLTRPILPLSNRTLIPYPNLTLARNKDFHRRGAEGAEKVSSLFGGEPAAANARRGERLPNKNPLSRQNTHSLQFRTPWRYLKINSQRVSIYDPIAVSRLDQIGYQRSRPPPRPPLKPPPDRPPERGLFSCASFTLMILPSRLAPSILEIADLASSF